VLIVAAAATAAAAALAAVVAVVVDDDGDDHANDDDRMMHGVMNDDACDASQLAGAKVVLSRASADKECADEADAVTASAS
jgi:hypothetical protein